MLSNWKLEDDGIHEAYGGVLYVTDFILTRFLAGKNIHLVPTLVLFWRKLFCTLALNLHSSLSELYVMLFDLQAQADAHVAKIGSAVLNPRCEFFAYRKCFTFVGSLSTLKISYFFGWVEFGC